MTDYSRAVRRAALPALKTTPGVTALVAASEIYPSTVPAAHGWPFIRWGTPIASPFRATGLDSSTIRVTIHGFCKVLLDGSGALIDTAESQGEKIGAAIVTALDGRVLDLDGGMHVNFTWVGTNLSPDGADADAWHAAVQFEAAVAG